MSEDDEDEAFGSLFEDGHWVWDDTNECLQFVSNKLRTKVARLAAPVANCNTSDLPPVAVETMQLPTKAPTGTVQFRDDIDVLEQMRFRRRYQRKLKPGQDDVIAIQDVKDVALYTAPLSIMSPALINMLHLPTAERFVRALVLYCQYYLQISDEMAHRMIELEARVRTPACELIEGVYKDNLNDLKVLVAKEYCTMLIGGGDTRKFHHMGPAKKSKSLSDKDARQFETLLRMCVQIVWLALGRKCFNQIELEVNRLFKSEIFNAVEHLLHTGYVGRMTPEERAVLLGPCLRRDKKLNTQSPLMNEVMCHRGVDYRMVGLGVIEYARLPARLAYMLAAVAGPEEGLAAAGVSLGVLGMPRARFDTMLRPVQCSEPNARASVSSKATATKSSLAGSKSSQARKQSLFPDIMLPAKEELREYPDSFPDAAAQHAPVNETQRRRWQKRLFKLMHPQACGRD